MKNITYINFLKAQYEKNNYKHLYASFENFKKSSLSFGFQDWLLANSNTKPDLRFLTSVAKTYIRYGCREASDIPMLLASLQRQYDIEVPVIEGVMTKDFWIKKLT